MPRSCSVDVSPGAAAIVCTTHCTVLFDAGEQLVGVAMVANTATPVSGRPVTAFTIDAQPAEMKVSETSLPPQPMQTLELLTLPTFNVKLTGTFALAFDAYKCNRKCKSPHISWVVDAIAAPAFNTLHAAGTSWAEAWPEFEKMLDRVLMTKMQRAGQIMVLIQALFTEFSLTRIDIETFRQMCYTLWADDNLSFEKSVRVVLSHFVPPDKFLPAGDGVADDTAVDAKSTRVKLRRNN